MLKYVEHFGRMARNISLKEWDQEKKRGRLKEKEQVQQIQNETNSGWIMDLNVKCKTIKFLEDNKGENLGGLQFGDDQNKHRKHKP